MWNKRCVAFTLFMICCLNCRTTEKLETIQLKLGEKIFDVELAVTGEEQEQGLMFRKKLGDQEGMLFVYTRYVKHGFWMQNTSIPLSIAFLDDNGKILDIKNMTPFSTRSVIPEYSYMYALEVNKGTFSTLGLEKGDTIGFPPGFLP